MNSILLAILIAFLWGISPVIFKYLLGDVDMKVIMVLTAVIYTLCTALYTIPSWRDIYRSIIKINHVHMFWIVVNAALLTFVANLLFLIALKNNSKSYVITSIAFSAPLFSLLIAYLFLNQQITYHNLIGVVLIVTGIFVLSYFK